MSFNATKTLPPARSTGDTPTGGVAADINALAAAIAELQAAHLALAADLTNITAAGVATFADLPTAVAAGNANQIPVGTLVVVPA